jgi:hypothetical protein
VAPEAKGQSIVIACLDTHAVFSLMVGLRGHVSVEAGERPYPRQVSFVSWSARLAEVMDEFLSPLAHG